METDETGQSKCVNSEPGTKNRRREVIEEKEVEG